MDMALKDRINFLSKKKYCFGCLQPMKPKHNAKNCDKRLNCRTCSGGHPTAMRVYVPKRKKDAKIIKGAMKMMSLSPIALLT